MGNPLPQSYFGELLQDREPPSLGSVSVYSQCLAWNLEQRRGSIHTCRGKGTDLETPSRSMPCAATLRQRCLSFSPLF